MKRILITGATGNIGHEVIRFLYDNNTPNQIIAGVRNIDKAKIEFKNYAQLDYVQFDFEDSTTFDKSLDNIDCIFLLRPPHISDIDNYFYPLIKEVKAKKITQVVFLSVQGAEKSKIIPHNQIEKLITDYGLDFIFLRPSYFMQNLTTTLLNDIQVKRKIILPAGKAKFNWVDIENIGESTAKLLNDFDNYKNRVIELTGYENLDFYQVTDLINETINNKIKFDNANFLRFFWTKKKDGLNAGLIIVMMMLHLLPRFQSEPKISTFYEKLTGKKPTKLKEFIKRENKILTHPNIDSYPLKG